MGQYTDLDAFLGEREPQHTFTVRGIQYTTRTEIMTAQMLAWEKEREEGNLSGQDMAQKILAYGLGDEQLERLKENTNEEQFQFASLLVMAKLRNEPFDPRKAVRQIRGEEELEAEVVEAGPKESPSPGTTSSGSGRPSNVMPVRFGVYPHAV
jgi:hypothetical protein